MTGGNKGVFIGTFLTIFIFILVVGLVSDVSIGASFSRAFLAALMFTGILLVVVVVNGRYVFPKPLPQEALVSDEVLGRKLDVTLDETSPDFGEVNSAAPADQGQEAELQGQPAMEFVPLNARQIDPQVNKIINSDPEKVAEIVRKMGLEEEN